MLEIRNVSCFYGRLQVLFGVSLAVGAESVALLGPNGAGKTTLIGAVLGFLRPQEGEILFDGKPLCGRSTHEIARMGIALVPQNRELFPLMNVRENLEAGADYMPHGPARKASRLEFVCSLFPALRKRLRQAAGTLSGGEQRMLAIGRALMASPKLLVLDEPSLGLQPSLVKELYAKLAEMKKTVSIFVTEQNVRLSLRSVDRGYVLENGRIAFEDSAQGLRDNPHVIESYLGV